MVDGLIAMPRRMVGSSTRERPQEDCERAANLKTVQNKNALDALKE